MHWLAFIMLVVAIALGLLAGYSFSSAFGLLRVKLPAIFTGLSQQHAVDAYIWDEIVPAAARRKYFVYLVAATLGAAFMGAAVFIQGERIGALLFGAVFVVGIVQTTNRWRRYRSRL